VSEGSNSDSSDADTSYSGAERRKGRIDEPPDQRSRASFPKEFGSRYLIFVDTEEEFDWTKPLRRENRAVTAMDALPEAHSFFRGAGALPAYMADYPVVDDDHSAAILRTMHEQDGSEIGTQLHPWVNPPYQEEVTPHNSFTGNLPVALQRAKLHRLTDRIEEQIGERPTVYRAGRYGIGDQSASLLEAAGYRMDSSVRALFDYSGEGGPNFSGFTTDAFWAGQSRRLLEVPLSATYIGAARMFGNLLYPLGEKIGLLRSVLARTGMVQRISLTPEDYPLDIALKAITQMLGDGQRIFSLSYHSPSVEPGHTPYVRDAADLRTFYAWWDGVFEMFAKHGVTAARAGDVVDAARSTLKA
jgi:hypothetical protein